MKEINKVKEERPLLISICCISAFVNVITGGQIIQDAIFDWYCRVSILLVLICVIGLWKMKLFAVFIYLSVFIVNQLILLVIEKWLFFQAVLPAVIIMICFNYLKKMT